MKGIIVILLLILVFEISCSKDEQSSCINDFNCTYQGYGNYISNSQLFDIYALSHKVLDNNRVITLSIHVINVKSIIGDLTIRKIPLEIINSTFLDNWENMLINDPTYFSVLDDVVYGSYEIDGNASSYLNVTKVTSDSISIVFGLKLLKSEGQTNPLSENLPDTLIIEDGWLKTSIK